MDSKYLMKQVRRALELFVQTIADDSTAMEVADVFPEWIKDNHTYKAGERFRWGVDALGDTQIWQVLQNHTSQPNWTPDTAVSLYKRIGVTEDGVVVYTKPHGTSDAYMAGNRVMFDDGHIRKCLVDYCVYDYIEYPAGWVIDD